MDRSTRTDGDAGGEPGGVSRRRMLGLVGAGAVGGLGATTVPGGLLGDRPAPAPPDNTHAAPGGGSPLGARRLIWSGDPGRRTVALTFDDGPDPALTPGVLEVLASYGVTATFMVMGHNAEAHRDLLRAVVDAGHEVGNHTWTHLDLSSETPVSTSEQLERGTMIIRDVAGVDAGFFRPPQGRLTGAALHAAGRLGQDVLMWSATREVAGVGRARQVAESLLAAARPGALVGLHDGVGRGTFSPDADWARRLRARRAVELEALPQVLEGLLERGLQPVTVSELVGAPAPPPADMARAVATGGTPSQWARSAT